MKNFFLLILLISSFACSKRSAADKDYDSPVITLNSPVNNQTFTSGQSINVTGSVSDNKYIKVIHIVITNSTTGTEYLHLHIEPSDKSAVFTQSLVAQAGINYLVEVIAEDPSANISNKKTEVSCN